MNLIEILIAIAVPFLVLFLLSLIVTALGAIL